MADVKPVTYRQRQALETKRRIADVARKLFADNGYAATSIEAIAAEVGVAVRTVYAAFGTKKAILSAICDRWLQESETIELVGEAMKAPDPTRRLQLLARASRRQWEKGPDILAMLELAAATDSEIRTLVTEWAGHRAAAMRQVLEGVPLAGDLETASAVVRTLTGPQVYQSLVVDCGWAPQRFEVWLGEALIALLMAPAPSPA